MHVPITIYLGLIEKVSFLSDDSSKKTSESQNFRPVQKDTMYLLSLVMYPKRSISSRTPYILSISFSIFIKVSELFFGYRSKPLFWLNLEPTIFEADLFVNFLLLITVFCFSTFSSSMSKNDRCLSMNFLFSYFLSFSLRRSSF